MQRWLFLTLAVIAIIAGLTIGILNAEPVILDIVFTQIDTSIGMVVTGSFACGLLLGILSLWVFRVLPLSLAFKRLKREQTKIKPSQTASLPVEHK